MGNAQSQVSPNQEVCNSSHRLRSTIAWVVLLASLAGPSGSLAQEQAGAARLRDESAAAIVAGRGECTVVLTGQFEIGADLLSPRPSIPLLAPSLCSDCDSAYQCTEGSNDNTPNRFNLHAVAPAGTNRCIEVNLVASCVGTPGNNNLGSAAWLSPFLPNGDKCDATKIGTVGEPSPWPPRNGSYSFALPPGAGADVIVFEQKGGANPPHCDAPYTITIESCECPVAVDLESFDVEP